MYAKLHVFFRKLFFVFLSMGWMPIYAQLYLDAFPSSLIDSANTAANIKYLTEQERLVHVYVNLARMRPELFLEKIVNPYTETNGLKGAAVSSLKSDLKKLKPLPPLLFDKGLYDSAKEHATTTGEKGTTGHAGMKTRFQQYARGMMHWYGENCSYGEDNDTALNAVMQLLIDESVEDRGHRENILSRDYSYMGTSIHSHKVWGYTCVQDFGSKK